jgi:predicted metal-binding membrane protein
METAPSSCHASPTMALDGSAVRRSGSIRPRWVAAALLVAALVTWLLAVAEMEGMDAGPGTDLGAPIPFLGIWVTMMAAMMLPSAAPMVAFYARLAETRAGRRRSIVLTTAFVAGYLAVWTAIGLLAVGLYRLIDVVGGGLLAWDEAGPYVAGGAIVGAGIYQLTPLKRVCLRHCRAPLLFLLSSWRPGLRGATRLGVGHGAYCVGCCWGLMLVLFAVGVMSVAWMVAIAVVIFAEKVLPWGERLATVFAAAFVALGVVVAAAPDSVPGLTDPMEAPMTHTHTVPSKSAMR